MIYICIPVLNEAPTVGILLWRIRQVMTEFRRDYHLLVVDDGSTDASAEVLQPYTRVLPLTVVSHGRNRGYAAALETLAREAVERSSHPKRDVAVFLQADFTEPPEEIPALVKKMEGGADLVGSSVAAVQGEVTRGMRWSRRGLPWLLKGKGVPGEIRDPFSGFRAYRVQVLKRALQDAGDKPLLTRAGWAANAELLLRVSPHARRADDAPVELRLTRRERETRFEPWETLKETWALARLSPRRARPVAPEGPPPAPEPVQEAAAAPARMSRRDRPRHAPPAAPAPAAAATPAQEPVAETAAETASQPRRPRRERNRAPKPSPETVETAAPADVAPAEVLDGAAAEAPRVRKRKPRRRKPKSATAGEAGAAAAGGDEGVMEAPAAAGSAGEATAEAGEPDAGPSKPRRPRRPRRRKPAGAREGQPAADGAPAPNTEREERNEGTS